MSPAEDAALLLAIVRRHLRSLRIGLEQHYPAGFAGRTPGAAGV